MPEISIGNHNTNTGEPDILYWLSKINDLTKLNIVVERYDDLTKRLFKKSKPTYCVYVKFNDVESQQLTERISRGKLIWFLKGFYIGAVNELKS